MSEYELNLSFLRCSHYFFGSNIDRKEVEHRKNNKNLVLSTIDILEKKFNYLDTESFIDLFQFLDTPFFQEGLIYNVEFNYTMYGNFIPAPQIFIGSYVRQIYHYDTVVFRDEEGNNRYVKVCDGNYFIPIYR
jgi:hypothetical protein